MIDKNSMKKATCGIYKITSPSKKIYIGQSINIEKRTKYYKSLNCKQQHRIYNSIKKHGWHKHKFEIIHICMPDELDELEVYYIDLYQTLNSKYGLNLREGGGIGAKMSDESRLKLSLALKGRPSPNKGVAMSEEQKKKISESNKGKKLSLETRKKLSLANIGKKRSPESIEKTAKANKGRVVSETTKQKLSQVNRGRVQKNKAHKLSPKIAQEIRRLYYSGNYKQIKLAEMYGISRPTISNIVRSNGIIWKNGI